MAYNCIILVTPSPVTIALIVSSRILTSADITYSDWVFLADFGMQHRTLASNRFSVNFYILMLGFESTPTPFIFV